MNARDQSVLTAAACGLETAVALYAVIRIVQALIGHEPNPAMVAPSAYHGYFWRAWIAAYGGGAIALVVAVVQRSPERTAHVATRALPIAAVLLAAQAAFLP